MTFKIEVSKSSTESVLFTQQFVSLEEFNNVKNLCGLGWKKVNFLEANLITVRTHNFQAFCEDFFLPSFINHALKIDDTVVKMIMTPTCFFFDLLTLPVRVITLLPRVIYNLQYPKETHPFHRYLSDAKANAQLLNQEHLYVKMKWEEIDSGVKWSKHLSDSINLIDLPVHNYKDSYSSGGVGLPI